MAGGGATTINKELDKRPPWRFHDFRANGAQESEPVYFPTVNDLRVLLKCLQIFPFAFVCIIFTRNCWRCLFLKRFSEDTESRFILGDSLLIGL